MSATPKQLLHRKAIKRIQSYLGLMGHKTHAMPETNCKFDLLVNGLTRCEVKAAQTMQVRGGKGQPKWQFNLQRHGKIDVGYVDVYAFYLLGVPGFVFGIWLIVPAREVEGRHQIFISNRSLLCQWSKWYGRWELFGEPVRRREAA